MTQPSLPMKPSQPPQKRTSQILRDLLTGHDGQDPTLGQVLRALDDRAFGLTMLILVAPNCIPFPPLPIVSSITGIPLMLIALQFAWGRHTVWIPKRYADKVVPASSLTRIVNILAPRIEWLERGIKPRWPVFTNMTADRLIGAVIALLAFVMSLPIVAGNVPPALAILVIALGLIESDGRTIFVGLVMAALAVIWVGLILFVGIEIITTIFPFAEGWFPFMPTGDAP